ncbi:MAG TPA: DMT family transporter [Candidatus Limnocylindrales bacterium]|nr:DMT family transporter [Candidatus Limnocylindrales bacterium]
MNGHGAPRSRSSAPLFVAIAVTLLTWSSAYSAIRYAVRAFPPASLALLRFTVASVTLALLTLPTGRVSLRGMPRRDLGGFLLMGLLAITIYHTALNAGERTVSAGAASLLINTSPIWTALVATAFLGERLGARGWIGTALAFLGAVIISLGASGGIRFEGGVGFIIVASLCQAVYIVRQKKYLARYGALQSTCLTIWTGTFLLLPFLPECWRALRVATPAEIGAAVYLGVAPGAIGYVTWTYVLSRLPASRAASLLYLISPFAYLTGWAVLGERPGAAAFLGGIPIIAGVALVNARRAVPRPEARPEG